MPAHRSSLRDLARQVPGLRRAASWLRSRGDPAAREIHRLRFAEPAALQPFPDTAEDRYPQLFDALARHLAALPAPRVLSLGCSSGAEVRALRRRLPHARIIGVDLNRAMIAAARAADPDHSADYREGSAPPPGEQFDAVLALAVLRHGVLEAEQPEDCSTVLSFVRFEQALAALDGALAAGGWLALWNAHFRLADSRLAPRYADSGLRQGDQPPQSQLYGPDNRRLDGVSEAAVLFQKLS